MRLFVLGGSGGVGRHLLEQASAAGHEVVAVVRRPSGLPALPGLRLVAADPLSPASMEEMRGCEAVVSSLGLKRANPANPWSTLVSPEDFCSATAGWAIEAMQRLGLKRVVAVSAAGVADSAPGMNAVMRVLVGTSRIGVAYRDLARMEALYAASGLDWCCVRPTRLTDGPRTDRFRQIDDFPMAAAISRADVAAWLLAEVVKPGPLSPRLPTVTGG